VDKVLVPGAIRGLDAHRAIYRKPARSVPFCAIARAERVTALWLGMRRDSVYASAAAAIATPVAVTMSTGGSNAYSDRSACGRGDS
jgi:hypothetical protein